MSRAFSSCRPAVGVSDSAVKDQREQKIVAELTHIREYFRRRVANR